MKRLHELLLLEKKRKERVAMIGDLRREYRKIKVDLLLDGRYTYVEDRRIHPRESRLNIIESRAKKQGLPYIRDEVRDLAVGNPEEYRFRIRIFLEEPKKPSFDGTNPFGLYRG